MKNYFLGFALIFGLIGCMPLATDFTTHKYPVSKPIEIPKVNLEVIKSIGDVFFEWNKLDLRSGVKWELTIIELNKQKLGLQYSEYFWGHNGGWLIKQGFTKRFDFTLTDLFVKYKDYECKILKVDNGQISYMRMR